jgi:uncharacterized protein (TIGR02270 family)
MATISFIAEVVDQHCDDTGALWVTRDRGAEMSTFRLSDLTRFDERLSAHIEGLAIASRSGWHYPLDRLDSGEAGEFFTAGVLAVATGESRLLDHIIECGSAAMAERKDEEFHRAYDAWAALVSALAWVSLENVTSIIDASMLSQQPRIRWLGVAVCGARRLGLRRTPDAPLSESSSLVRSRAYRTTGQLGRADLMAQLRPGLTDDDRECRFWSAWAAARMGAGGEALSVLADIAWNNHPRAVRALDILLRRLDVPQANAWLREFARLPGRQRDLIRATGVIGDPLYLPWLIERLDDPATARLAGEAFSMITGLDLAYRDLDRRPPADFQSGPNDDPEDENVALDEDEHLPWPDPEKIGQWWAANRNRFDAGTPYFLGTPKPAADWLEALSDAFQRQRHAAALELAIRQPDKAMFEVRARGRLQRQLIARARGLA